MTDWNDDTSVPDVGKGLVAADGPRTPTLVVMTGASLGEVFPLCVRSSVIGRAKEADLSIPDETISRVHARIVVEGDAIRLEDLKSRNSTFINGRQLYGGTEIDDGDRLQLGHATILRFAYLDPLEERFHKHLHESCSAG